MAQAPKKSSRTTPQQGPSPEALAAFYRHRSESLQNSHTTKKEGAAKMQTTQNQMDQTKRQTQGILEYVISALRGTPGVIDK